MEPYAERTPYFNTFGGTQASVAAAAVVLDIIEDEGLQDNALRVGEYFRAEARKLAQRHPMIADVRGAGLYLGTEPTDPGSDERAAP